jgi:hypothetical protein
MLYDELPLPDGKPHTFSFISAYQGMFDYRHASLDGRLHFRASRCPWLWGYEKNGVPIWNYANKEEFDRQHNGNHGMLTHGNEPVSIEVLAAFQAEQFAMAKTGYFDHLTMSWVECDPISSAVIESSAPGHLSWIAAHANHTEKAIAAATSNPTPAARAELAECLANYMPRTVFTEAARLALAHMPEKAIAA